MGREKTLGTDPKNGYERKVATHWSDARALALIELGFRTSIVHLETNLPTGRIRDLFHGWHGLAGSSLKPSSGSLPESDTILKTRANNAEGTLFVLLYLRFAGDGAKHCINIDAIIKAHRLLTGNRARFGAVFTNQPLDVNQAWVLARDFRSDTLKLRRCIHCSAPYLVVDHQHNQPKCPFCAMSPASEIGSAQRRAEG